MARDVFLPPRVNRQSAYIYQVLTTQSTYYSQLQTGEFRWPVVLGEATWASKEFEQKSEIEFKVQDEIGSERAVLSPSQGRREFSQSMVSATQMSEKNYLVSVYLGLKLSLFQDQFT